MTPEILVSTSPTASDRDALLDQLVAFNRSRAGPSGYAPLAIFLRDPASGRILGGLWGSYLYDWLNIELLFVPDFLQGQGLGSRLLDMAEAAARELGCVGVWLDTFGFQAPGFYEKRGYAAIGVIEDHPRGTRRFFFRKRFQGA